MKCVIAAFLPMRSMFLSEFASASEPKTILVFGDSLSDGFMLKRSEAYPARLARSCTPRA